MSRSSIGKGDVQRQSFDLRHIPAPPAFAGSTENELSVSAQVVLDSSLNPTFIVQSNGQILHSNAASQALLRSAGAFRLVGGHLCLHRKVENQALSDAVHAAAKDGMMGLLRLYSRPGEPSMLVRVMPTPWPDLVVICIAELQQKLRLPAGWSRVAFGFTPTNASLAEALADGLSLAEFAELNALPIGTVRTRLKKLMLQTGFSSQAALVASLLRGASVMADVAVSAEPRKAARTLITGMQNHR